MENKDDTFHVAYFLPSPQFIFSLSNFWREEIKWYIPSLTTKVRMIQRENLLKDVILFFKRSLKMRVGRSLFDMEN